MTDQERMPNPDIAFRRGPCKECGGKGYLIWQALGQPWCPTCGGTGETYLLGDMVREECYCGCHLGMYEPACEESCGQCHGLKFTPSTELGDWVKAAEQLGQAVIFTSGMCFIGSSMGVARESTPSKDPDPLTALKLALGKALEGR